MYRIGAQAASFLSQLPSLVRIEPLKEAADAAPAAPRLADEGRRYVAMTTAPLIHGTGIWAGLVVPHLVGGASVLLQGRSFDAGEVWGTAEAQQVVAVAIVGDAIGRPLLRHLQQALSEGRTYDLSRLRFLISAGAMFSAQVKTSLLELVPDLVIIDTRGKQAQTARFKPLRTTKVFAEDGREILPGSDEIGLLAVAGNVPLGYYKDEAKTATTFREIDGVRYAIPGDWAKVQEDGTIILVGRGNQCINTGGEKVFPEEVEEAVKTHPAVDDCLVFGIPDERFGQRVVAVAAAVPGVAVADEDVIAHTRARLAGYKVPRQIVFEASVPRTVTGKADYAAARRLWAERTAAQAASSRADEDRRNSI
jgi:fatty-acyl-CoA synthase